MHTEARSAPTYPWVTSATAQRSTLSMGSSSSRRMRRVSLERMSKRASREGAGMRISVSKRPERRTAGSRTLGLLVVAMTMTLSEVPMPSISVRRAVTICLASSLLARSRLGAMESTSSMKMRHAPSSEAILRASPKTDSRPLAPSPATMEGPLMTSMRTPVSFSSALAIIVLPVPGGPWRSTPEGGLTPMVVKRTGCLRGSSTTCLMRRTSSSSPPMSSQPMALSWSSPCAMGMASSITSLVAAAPSPAGTTRP
mmetsp:Transcript_14257/g.53989  ORF Transcript_14257/g.53989 Transcript_14257/m.53989 type:complete len:255 (-) Transcript_14257:587-1351(-)